MKLSIDTRNLLKNYASINPNIHIMKGNRIRTKTGAKSIGAEAFVAETFPMEFALHDLPSFLGVLSMFDDPDIKFNETHLLLSDDNKTIRYFYSDPSMLVVPTKELSLSDFVTSFTISKPILQEINNVSKVLSLQDFVIENDGHDKIKVTLVDLGKTKSVNSSNLCSFIFDNNDENSHGVEFKFSIPMESLKLLPGEYTVTKPKNVGCVQFDSNDIKLKYFVALSDYEVYNV